MKKRHGWRFALGLVLLLIAVLSLPQLIAHRRFRERGGIEGYPPPIADTGMPRTCVNAALEQYEGEALLWAVETIEAGGFTWVRQRFPWAAIEPQPGEFDWEPWDRIVATSVERGLQIIPVLDSPPAWAGTPPDPEAFARFAGALANHYMAQLVYYEVWHNPNLGETWDGDVDPYLYAELLALGAEAIRAADPDARIILGGLAPNLEQGPQNYNEVRFLESLYVAGAAPYFDVVGVQPYGFYTGPEDREVDLALMNFSRPLLVREVLAAHGDEEKAVWATHFGWNSLPPGWEGPPSIWGSVDEETQAAFTLAALDRAEEEWPWMGVMCLNTFQPRPLSSERAVPDAEEHWGFAVVGPEGEPRPVYAAIRAWSERPRVARPGVYPAGTSLAEFEGDWRLGPLGADIGLDADGTEGGERVRLTFEGTGVALTVRRGPYRAFLFVTIDGEPAPALPRDTEGRAYVVLYDPLTASETVPLAENLPSGRHTVEVVADRGWYHWALADWRVVDRPSQLPYRLGLSFLLVAGGTGLLLVLTSARHVWGARSLARLEEAYRGLREPVQVALTTVVGAVFAFAAWTSWGQGLFRRLGEGTELTAVLLAALLFYFSPWFLLTLVSGALLFLLVLLRPALGLALTIAAAPFYLHPLSLFGKSFSLAELVLLPTALGALVRWLGDRGWGLLTPRPRRGEVLPRVRAALFAPLLTLLLVSVLSALFADHTREALRELRLVIVEPLLFYGVLVLFPLQEEDRRRIVDFYVASALVIALVGLVQYFVLGDFITAEGGFRRLRSIYGSPNNVGLYLVRAIPFMLALVAVGQPETGEERGRLLPWLRNLLTSRRRLFYALALLPTGLALLLSFSRGALLLGLPLGLVTLGLLAGRRWRRVTLVALLLFVLALIPLFRTPRFAGLLDTRAGTTFFRLSLWHSAWQMFLDHPLCGVGPDNFLYAYRTRYVLPTAWEEFDLAHPHNWPLDFVTRLGLLGLLPFLWLLFQLGIRIRPLLREVSGREQALLLGAVASLVAALAHGLVDAFFFYIDLAYVFFFTLAVVTWSMQRRSIC
ncbi:MAG: O-antigen ligase family protein [Anaerolineales bacterium]